jgi:trehalose 6-phosphate phosphatase
VQESRTGLHLSRGRAARFLSRVLRPSVVGDRRLALLVDVDGTLVSFAPTPDAVVIDPGLRRLLDELNDVLDGALAIVSGRSIDNLDQLFPGASFAKIGSHGAEMRLSRDAAVLACVPRSAAIRSAREELQREADADPRLLVEDKGVSVALHYRRAPDREPWARSRVSALASQLGPDYQVQWGSAVAEVRATGFDKGTAIRALMEHVPFAGCCAVYFGDDETDLSALRAVADLGGVPISVGPRLMSAGFPHLESPSQVRETLLGLCVALRRSTAARSQECD